MHKTPYHVEQANRANPAQQKIGKEIGTKARERIRQLGRVYNGMTWAITLDVAEKMGYFDGTRIKPGYIRAVCYAFRVACGVQ